MSRLREIALAKLAKAGQRPGQDAGQQVSRPADFSETPRDSKNGGNLPQNAKCPGVPLPRGQDSGTAAEKSGHRAGQQPGQPGQIDRRLAEARCREWRAHLLRLDPAKPLHGLSSAGWARLLDDAEWIFENHALRAAQDGWSERDLFGLLPGKDSWGGVVDRLRGARSLVMTAERAGWRRVVNGTPDGFVRGAGDRPRLVPLWEAQ